MSKVIPHPSQPMEVARAFTRDLFPCSEQYPAYIIARWRGDWLIYDNGYWQAVEDRAVRDIFYRWAEDKTYMVKEPDGALEYLPWNPNKTRVSFVMDALPALVGIPSHIEPDVDFAVTDVTVTSHCNSNYSGGGVDSKTYNREVTVTSGTNRYLRVDLETGVSREAGPRWFNHHVLPIGWDPDARCPGWLGFLRELWPDDRESIDLLQEWAGYLISGETRAQKLMALIGPKRGGKGTIARVLEELVGSQYCASPTLSSLCENFGLQTLIGKRLAVIGDARLRAGAKDTSLAVSRLLMITGEDRIDIDRKHKDPWTGRLPVRFMVLSNETPRLTDASAAIASRFLFLQLTRSWYGQEDTGLLNRLLEELPGIFNWAVEGYQKLKADGFQFTEPDSAEEITQEMETLASPMKVFLHDCCELAAYHWVFTDEIFRAWQAWCQHTGNHAGSVNVFSRDLRAATDGAIGTRTGNRPDTGKRAKIMTGIRISPQANLPADVMWAFNLGKEV